MRRPAALSNGSLPNRLNDTNYHEQVAGLAVPTYRPPPFTRKQTDSMSSEKTGLRQIIALGGHSITTYLVDVTLSRYILNQAPAPRPRICFLPQGSGEDPLYIANFFRHFLALDALPSDLSLFKPHTADIADFLLQQDVIYVGGGNTKSMLSLWREWGLDQILCQAWEQGTVLSGVSAGAICWFEQGLTDSIPGKLRPLDCLGYLSGSCSPHFDGEAERRPSYHCLIANGKMADGYGVDNNTALHFIGAELSHLVSSRAGATAFRIERSSAGVSESRLTASVLVGLENSGGSKTIENNTQTDPQ